MVRYGYTRMHAVLDWLALRGCRRADALITISEDTKRSVVQQLGITPESVHVVHSGVNSNLFRRKAVDPVLLEKHGIGAGRHILHIGSEEPRKNLETLLRAFAQLRAYIPEAKLLRVGRPYYTQERGRLCQLAEALDLGDAVFFIDTVTDNELVGFYNLAELFVLPSLHEGFGLPVLEAFACGTPVVCSDVGALPEIAGDAAICVAPEDAGALSEAMASVLTDATLAKRLSDGGLERARQFTWQETARKTAKVYRVL
jgi:glycosyltransferase involved in cell wall biosynthesis